MLFSQPPFDLVIHMRYVKGIIQVINVANNQTLRFSLYYMLPL